MTASRNTATDDVVISRRLFDAGVLLGIDFLDSLIIGADGFLSLRESGFIG